MAQIKIYPKGLYMDKKRDGAPAFVKGKLSIKYDEFLAWLPTQKEFINEKGYMKFDLLKSEKDGKLYFTLDTYKASSTDGVPFVGKSDVQKASDEFNASDISWE